MQGGSVESLLHVYVYCAGNMTNFVGQFFRNQGIALLIVAGDGHVDRGRSAEVQNLRDDVGGLKKELHAGESSRKLLAKCLNVGAGWLAAYLFQLHQNFAVGSSKGTGVAI